MSKEITREEFLEGHADVDAYLDSFKEYLQSSDPVAHKALMAIDKVVGERIILHAAFTVLSTPLQQRDNGLERDDIAAIMDLFEANCRKRIRESL
jgi:hypothetical protein